MRGAVSSTWSQCFGLSVLNACMPIALFFSMFFADVVWCSSFGTYTDGTNG